MKLVVGLGNPGATYQRTRHNVGFDVVEEICKATSHKLQATSHFKNQPKFQAEVCKVGDVIFAKPQTFMNKSGLAVQKIASYYDIDTQDIYVIHDDLDIALGSFKIVRAKGPKIHNGVNSIEQILRTKNFWRVRVGVDSRTAKQREEWIGRRYVLAGFNVQDQLVFDQVTSQIVRQMTDLLIDKNLTSKDSAPVEAHLT